MQPGAEWTSAQTELEMPGKRQEKPRRGQEQGTYEVGRLREVHPGAVASGWQLQKLTPRLAARTQLRRQPGGGELFPSCRGAESGGSGWYPRPSALPQEGPLPGRLGKPCRP